jgi:hypothetical protein
MTRTLTLPMIAAMAPEDRKKVSEHALSVAIREFAEANSWIVWYTRVSAKKGADGQWRGVSPKGEPDLRMVRDKRPAYETPAIIFAELKKEGGYPTPEQVVALDVLGPYARLWRPRDAEQIMKELS